MGVEQFLSWCTVGPDSARVESMQESFLHLAYTVFIGILLAVFVGVGVAAFYEAPKPPEDTSFPAYAPSREPNQEEKDKAEVSQKAYSAHNKAMQTYNRDVAVIAITAAILLFIVSLTAIRTIPLISDGVLLGGILTLLYGIMRSFGANDSKFQFVVVTIGLVVALSLGYIKFVKPTLKPQMTA